MKRLLFAALLAVLFPVTANAQVTGLNTFSPNTRILSADVNFNFTKLADEACRRQGCTLTGNMTVDNGVTIDGVDLSAWLDQSVKTTASPTFANLTISTNAAVTGTLTAGTFAPTSLDVAQGAQFGSGNVNLVDSTGKIPALSSTYFASVDGTSLTGLAKLAATNTFTNRNDFKLYSETRTTPTIAGSALTLDLSAGTHFAVALNSNATITISNPVPSGTVGSFTVKFTADGTVRTLTWPGSVVWANGAAPTMTGTNGKRDFISCIYDDGGTTYFCTAVQNF